MRGTRSTNNSSGPSSRHPFPRSRHLTRWTLALGILLGLTGSVGAPGRNTPAATSPGAGPAQHKKGKHAIDYLLVAAVFTDQGFALPGARIRVRRAGERKVRRETFSNSRGEFALRVPQSAQYEMTVEAKGYQPERRTIDAREGDRQDLVFQLRPAPGGKKK